MGERKLLFRQRHTPNPSLPENMVPPPPLEPVNRAAVAALDVDAAAAAAAAVTDPASAWVRSCSASASMACKRNIGNAQVLRGMCVRVMRASIGKKKKKKSINQSIYQYSNDKT